ncbi:stringent starvation protein B domain protein [Wolbachia endosymbiont of Pentalonia nigronervosa]|jgi:hypothetical protein|uniref:ClpXP protease specificity-enhancing factor SspB n=1 Tax=Wolbachia endosymbiont of Pentalonia nigronervosa TaxID=1301914 RepID=UPI0016600058|nr:ClpXP protease specificity-enhancing factor SspB [Wolbachia endosymbiont of Pentalonia nigronervosa]MBD0391574.1 stringent starvation protein B domain protein [Wolbachia endosymbiont of Pentalonia nigronervosa]
MTINDTISYQKLLRPIKFQVIKKALDTLLNNNFVPHLEILFFTKLNGVIIPNHLKKSYPDQMLIVLQHQFYDLKVFENEFSVSLSFSGKQKQIVIPFLAISRFHDKISGDILMFTEDKNEERIEKFSGGNIISLDQLRKK